MLTSRTAVDDDDDDDDYCNDDNDDDDDDDGDDQVPDDELDAGAYPFGGGYPTARFLRARSLVQRSARRRPRWHPIERIERAFCCQGDAARLLCCAGETEAPQNDDAEDEDEDDEDELTPLLETDLRIVWRICIVLLGGFAAYEGDLTHFPLTFALPASLRLVYRALAYVLVGAGALTLADIALDDDALHARHGRGSAVLAHVASACARAAHFVLVRPVWWPLSALAYCASLTAVPTAVFVYWLLLAPEEASVGYMLEMYSAATLANLVVAAVLAVTVERPCMRLRALFGCESRAWSYGTAPASGSRGQTSAMAQCCLLMFGTTKHSQQGLFGACTTTTRAASPPPPRRHRR